MRGPVYYPTESNDLFTPGWTFGSMVNGQYTLNVVDGLHVPREYIWTRIETRHGSLGLDLLHRSAAMSTRVTVRFPNRAVYDEYEHRDLIPDNVIAGLRQGELFAHYTFPDWWVINLISWQTQTTYTNKNKEIRAAIEDADSILRGDNDCAKFFGKYGLRALAALDKLLEVGIIDGPADVRTGIRMSSPKGSSPAVYSGDPTQVGDTMVVTPAFRVFHTGVVNRNGPFFNLLSPARIGNYSPNSRESRVLQILHELAHMVYKLGGKSEPLIPPDRGSGGSDSEANTKTVLQNCRDQIEGLRKKKR